MRLWSGRDRPAGVRLLFVFATVVCGLKEESPEHGKPRRLDSWDSLGLLQTSADISDHGDRLLSGSKYVQPLVNVEDLQYNGPITVAGQKVMGVMDTGSFDLLTFRKANCQLCGKAAALTCAAPGCTVQEGFDGCLEYGSGKACANKAITDVNLGPIASKNQSFLLAYRAEMELLKEASFQAIVGIGMPSKADQLLPRMGIQYFSACLPSQSQGQMVWNDDKPGKGFTSMPVAGQVYWGLVLSDTQFDGPNGQLSLGCSPSCGAIMDTGTSLIGVPTTTYMSARRGLEEMGGDCKNLSSLPTLKFKLNGNDFELPPEAFVGKFLRKAFPWLPDWIPQPFVMDCELLLIDLGNLNTQKGLMWILGMPFFRYYYTTFDLGSPGGTNKAQMKMHTAPTSKSCSPGSRAVKRDRRLNMRVDPTKVLVPKWARDAMASVRAGHGVRNITVPF